MTTSGMLDPENTEYCLTLHLAPMGSTIHLQDQDLKLGDPALSIISSIPHSLRGQAKHMVCLQELSPQEAARQEGKKQSHR